MELAKVATVIMTGRPGCDETILSLRTISIRQLGPFTAASTGGNFRGSDGIVSALSVTFTAEAVIQGLPRDG